MSCLRRNSCFTTLRAPAWQDCLIPARTQIMAPTRKRKAPSAVDQQGKSGTPEALRPRRARRKTTKTVARKSARQKTQKPAVPSSPEIMKKLQILDEHAHQSLAMIQELREIQQRLLQACSSLKERLEAHLGSHQSEHSAVQQELRALLKTIEERTAERKTEVQPTSVAAPKAPVTERGWLGVTVDAAVWVTEVQAGSLAQTAGIVQGDVITGIDNTPVRDPVQLWTLVQAKE